ncbi:MarR family transcriptional regulator [Paenibacillus sp. TRM 82003]|nr:MarR family transcriptional regulator [Paenibacillus sp. TRM 82003]
MMDFEQAHREWMDKHLACRTGERKGRLERGHGYGEKLFLRYVWWPIFGNFEQLHPEYEILDWRGRSYFADFVWLPGPVRLVIEVKGYGPHVQGLDRRGYRDELNRELFMQGAGYRVVSIAVDELKERPDTAVALFRLLLGRFQPGVPAAGGLTPSEREVLLLTYRSAGAVRPVDVANHLQVNYRTAAALLRKLCELGWMRANVSPGGRKVFWYELARTDVQELSRWG